MKENFFALVPLVASFSCSLAVHAEMSVALLATEDL